MDYIKVLVNKFKGQEKQIFLAGDFKINSLDYSRNTIVRDFFNLAYQNSIFPVINRPTRVTKTSATIIDHILTNTIIDSPLHSGIVKTDISDHFAVSWLLKTNFEQSNIKNVVIKRDIDKASIERFKSLFNSIDWNLVTQTSLPNDSYNIFFRKICTNLRSSISWRKNWNKSKESCQYLDYSGFEKIFKEETEWHCENDIKNTWKIMKSIIGKSRVQNDSFPKSLIIANKEIIDKKINSRKI